jgi:hypothetical protein
MGKGFHSSQHSRPVLGPTQPPIQWVMGVKRPGRKVDQHLHITPRLRMSGATPPLPLYAFTVWSGATFRTCSICPMFIFAVLKDKMRIFVMDTQLVTEFFSLFSRTTGLKCTTVSIWGSKKFCRVNKRPSYIKRLDTAGPCSEPNKFNAGM